MRFTTIRARMALFSTLFAVVLIGSVTFATYLLVARGMERSALQKGERLVAAAQHAWTRAEECAALEAKAKGVTGAEADALVARSLIGTPPDVIRLDMAEQGAFRLWIATPSGGDPMLEWSTDAAAPVGSPADRLDALKRDTVIRRVVGQRPLLWGMFLRANLGHFIGYIPVSIPGVGAGVLEAEYMPVDEEAILDATRMPMVIVTAIALAASLLLTQITMRWALALVDNLRRTAESINVGRLDVRLPEQGNNEVTDLARSLNNLIENLRRGNEAQARFIADASHELATPVAGIRGYVNILRAWGAEDPELREEAVSAIDRESRRMARLCSDLLSMIRNEEVVEYRQIRYDVNAVSREVLANAATRYIDKQLEFAGPDEGPLWLYGDPDRIEEALGILVDNACKYTPSGGRVSVTTGRHRDRVVIEVSDTGVGIPEQDLSNVFDRFYRSDISRSKETGGFGLGLAIAKHIIDASGGEISVRSTIGEGTTFDVRLPRQRIRQS